MPLVYESITIEEAAHTCMTKLFEVQYPAKIFEDVLVRVRWCSGIDEDLIYVIITFGKPLDASKCCFRRFAGNAEESPLAEILAETNGAEQEAVECEQQHENSIHQFLESN